MLTFLAVVHKDADSAYGVQFPDLPGCYSAADKAEDVIPNAMEALELWFELDAPSLANAKARQLCENFRRSESQLAALP